MLIYEIYLFFIVTVAIIAALLYKFIFRLVSPVFKVVSYLWKQYYKITNLNKVKDQVLEGNMKKKENAVLNHTNSWRNRKKLNKLFLQVELFKQKWDLNQLEKKLIEILSIDENNKKALEMLSNLYIMLWKEKKAFPLLKKLIQIDMENDGAIWNLSKIYLDLWEIDTAEILIKKAVSLNPNNHKYYVTLADILYNKWKLEEAAEAIKKILQIKPNNVIYMDALATLYEEIGEERKAKAIWLEILDLEPDYEKAKEKIK